MKHHVATTSAIAFRDRIKALQAAAKECWSCGDPATRPDGLCRDCGTIDAQAVPDIHDAKWKGHGYATSDVMVAPPNAKRVR